MCLDLSGGAGDLVNAVDDHGWVTCSVSSADNGEAQGVLPSLPNADEHHIGADRSPWPLYSCLDDILRQSLSALRKHPPPLTCRRAQSNSQRRGEAPQSAPAANVRRSGHHVVVTVGQPGSGAWCVVRVISPQQGRLPTSAPEFRGALRRADKNKLDAQRRGRYACCIRVRAIDMPRDEHRSAMPLAL